jgi:hypothetical protein
MGSFPRTEAGMDQLGFVRGPARILAAPMSQAAPGSIGDVIKLTGSDVNEVQSLTITGTPTGGTFKLVFRDVATATIAYNATASAVQAALEAISTIGAGSVVCTGGPLPGTAVTITFQGTLAGRNVPTLAPSAVAFTGGTTPAVAVTTTTPGSGLYDPVGSWFELGGTKDGVTPSYNDADEEFTIDQYTTIIGALPNNHEWAVQTSLVEVTPEKLSIAWDQGPVTLNMVPAVPEKRIGMGTPTGRTQRRVAVLHRRDIGALKGLLICHFFRIMQRAGGQESSLTYAPTGEQQRVPIRWRALPDTNVTDENETIGYILYQQPS